MVEYHIVWSLFHGIVLGFIWLHTCNPHIDCLACTLSVKVPGRLCILAGLPCTTIAHVEIASLDSIYKEVDHGSAAWFTIIHLVETPDAMRACGTFSGGESRDA